MADGQTDVSAAEARLNKALAALEGRMRALKAQANKAEGDLFASAGPGAREKALEEAAAAASAALGRAADEIRAVLGGEG
jgi:hypothetical protein